MNFDDYESIRADSHDGPQLSMTGAEILRGCREGEVKVGGLAYARVRPFSVQGSSSRAVSCPFLTAGYQTWYVLSQARER